MVVLEFFGFRSLNPSAFPSSSSHCRSVLCAGAPMERRKGGKKQEEDIPFLWGLVDPFQNGFLPRTSQKKERKGGNPKKSPDPPPHPYKKEKGLSLEYAAEKGEMWGCINAKRLEGKYYSPPFFAPLSFWFRTLCRKEILFSLLKG